MAFIFRTLVGLVDRPKITRTTFRTSNEQAITTAREFLQTMPIAERINKGDVDFPITVERRRIIAGAHTDIRTGAVTIELPRNTTNGLAPNIIGTAIHEIVHSIDAQTIWTVPEAGDIAKFLRSKKRFLPWNYFKLIRYKSRINDLLEGRAMLYEWIYYKQIGATKAIREQQLSTMILSPAATFFSLSPMIGITALVALSSLIEFLKEPSLSLANKLFYYSFFSVTLDGLKKMLNSYYYGFYFMRKMYEEHRDTFEEFERANLFYKMPPTKKEFKKRDVKGYIKRVKESEHQLTE